MQAKSCLANMSSDPIIPMEQDIAVRCIPLFVQLIIPATPAATPMGMIISILTELPGLNSPTPPIFFPESDHKLYCRDLLTSAS